MFLVSSSSPFHGQDAAEGTVEKLSTPHPGRASISIRDDAKILAIAGWDGRYIGMNPASL